MSQQLNPKTIAAQALTSTAGHHDDAATPANAGTMTAPSAIIPAIDITSTYERDADNAYSSGYCYGRADNATVRQAEGVINALEGGASAMLFGSGMAAAVTAFLALPRPAHVVAPQVMYWSLRNWLVNDAPSHGIKVDFYDNSDLDSLRAAVKPGVTKMVWVETPSNPLWTITDIATAARIAHDAGALLCADSTVATPVLTQPLALGADVAMHSATKYLNGHSDVLAGALVFAATNDHAGGVHRLRGVMGPILGGFEAALLLRGLRTVHLRVAHQCRAALAIAQHFDGHPAVASVLYPGLPTHPGHDLAARQMNGGFGGMLSIRVNGGKRTAIATAAQLKLWRRATSLGGAESLVEHRASIEGPSTPCPSDLLRLSVGLEDPADLIADLEAALSAASTEN